MIVVADSSPLIFLGRIRRLGLIQGVLGGEVLVPDLVRGEVLAPPLDPAEGRVLEAFLDRCRVVAVRRARHFATAMSDADNAALTLAVRTKADHLLSDDRIVRNAAAVEGIHPLGTLGLLLLGVRQGVLGRAQARRDIDRLIRLHGFRIGVELYQAVQRRLDRGS